jgi:hypothetical protein
MPGLSLDARYKVFQKREFDPTEKGRVEPPKNAKLK